MKAPFVIAIGLVGMYATLSRSPLRIEPSPTFRGLGVLPDGPAYSRANGISADGKTVVGERGAGLHGFGVPDTRPAFCWMEAGALEYVGPPHWSDSRAIGVSADGSVIVGDRFRWANGVSSDFVGDGSWQILGLFDVTDDGNFAVGSAWDATTFTDAGVTDERGETRLPQQPAFRVSVALRDVLFSSEFSR